MSDMGDFNAAIIEEFRNNQGRVGGNFEGAPLLLLHSTGAKSGTERINPVMYRQDGEHLYIFASKAGAPTNPRLVSQSQGPSVGHRRVGDGDLRRHSHRSHRHRA